MTRVRRFAMMCAATVIALSGCGAAEDSAGNAPTVPPSTQSVPPRQTSPGGQSAPVVAEQLKFTATTVDGQQFEGESLAGKPAVLWFWASWCPKCQAEAQGVAEAAKSAAGSVSFLGVAALSDVAAMQGFVERYEVGGFPHLDDEDAAIWNRFGVVEQPAFAFIAADGTVEVVTTRVSSDDLLQRTQDLAG